MKLSTKRHLQNFAAGTATLGAFGGAIAFGVVHDHRAEVQRHEGYAHSIESQGSDLCRLGQQAIAGDPLNARVLQLQIASKVQSQSRFPTVDDLLVCKGGATYRIVGDDSFETDTFRAG